MYRRKQTMKKIYQNPITTVLKIEMHHIMAGSETLPISEETVDDATTAESRHHSVWDDEDDYDD